MDHNHTGYLLLDKPFGWSSFDCVRYLKKKYRIKKVGHAGTLDPAATGLLIVLFGKATKWFDHFQAEPKTYEAKLIFGCLFDTQDITGELLEFTSLEKYPSKLLVDKSLNNFLGPTTQRPPIYSALKVNGKPAYSYARKGQTVELASREINVSQIKCLNYQYPYLTFEVRSSKGMYVRTLCHDIAHQLGTIATMVNLVRTEQGGCNLKQAYSIDSLPEPDELVLSSI